MKENVVKTKSFQFALKIIAAYKNLQLNRKEYILSKQLLRSGTSVGAMIREAEYAQSKADFIHKLSIAQKECNETLYWIELLESSTFINRKVSLELFEAGTELIKLLTSIIVSSKKSLPK